MSVSCPTHPEYYLTNICTLSACVEPLCPECIPKHIKQHTVQGQTPNIENIQTVRNQSKTLIFDILQKLKEQQFLLNNQDSKMYLQNAILKLQQAKNELQNVLDQIFFNLEKQLKTLFTSILIPQDDNLKEIINKQVTKMEVLQNQFLTNDYIKAILQTYIEGIGPSVYQKLEIECADILGVFPEVVINNSALSELKYHIETYVAIQKGQQSKYAKLQDSNIAQKLVGEVPDQPPLLVSQKSLQNQVYLSNRNKPTEVRGSFKPPQFAQNFSELADAEVEVPFKPIQILQCGDDINAPLLVSFYEDQKKVLQYNYVNNEFKEFSLNIDKRIPVAHQSIVYGTDILLIGGIDRDFDRSASVASVYKLNVKEKTLTHHSNMIHRRQGFGAALVDKSIYVCGGSYTDSEDSSINALERYDGVKWSPLRSCLHPATGCQLINLRDEFLIKSGGIDKEFNAITSIETYSIRQNIWFDVNVFDERGNRWITMPNYAGGIQVNSNEILIFGGQQEGEYTDNSFLVTFDIQGLNIGSSSVRRVHSVAAMGNVNGGVRLHNGSIWSILSEGITLLKTRKRVVNGGNDKWNYINNINDKWTISEKYNANPAVDYKKTIVDVCKFRSVEEFGFLMKSTIYAKVTEIFSEPQKYKLFKHFNENQDVQIEAIQFFKNDIQPWWEDEHNSQGGEIQFEISTQYLNIYDTFYSDLLLEIIGQANEEHRHINGLRVLDKINTRGNNQYIRFEMWLDIDPKDHSQNAKKLEDMIINLGKNYGLKELNFKYISHKK